MGSDGIKSYIDACSTTERIFRFGILVVKCMNICQKLSWMDWSWTWSSKFLGWHKIPLSFFSLGIFEIQPLCKLESILKKDVMAYSICMEVLRKQWSICQAVWWSSWDSNQAPIKFYSVASKPTFSVRQHMIQLAEECSKIFSLNSVFPWN